MQVNFYRCLNMDVASVSRPYILGRFLSAYTQGVWPKYLNHFVPCLGDLHFSLQWSLVPVMPARNDTSENPIGYFSQLFRPKPTWTAGDVPDQTGKMVIVTGGKKSVGKETAKVVSFLSIIIPLLHGRPFADETDRLWVLLSKGAKLYIAARSEKSQRAIEELKRETGKGDIHLLSQACQ
jgi:hypothetical protein